MENAICNLELQVLTKIYSAKKVTKKALAGVSFTLGPGLYGLLGPNGAGKSTMMNIITGNLDATSGKVLWNGKNVLRMGREFRRVLGYMPQQQNLYDSFTGRRFLLYIAALKEIPRSDAALQVQRVAELVHLSSELEKRLAAYSGGMKQRLLAAAALLGEPQILIMDEPTAGLDPKERVRLRQVLAQLAHDRIIIVATHVVSDVEHVASEILLLKEGQLVDQASPAALIEKYAPGGTLEDVYLAICGEDEAGYACFPLSCARCGTAVFFFWRFLCCSAPTCFCCGSARAIRRAMFPPLLIESWNSRFPA